MRTISQIVILLCFPISAHAYIGPGAGLSAIGSAFALAAVILLFIVGFLWYPIKRMLRGQDGEEDAIEADGKNQSSDESSGLS